MKKSIVKDMALADSGHKKIDWAKSHMPVLNSIHERFEAEQPFKGLNVVICLHLEAKTAYLAKVIQAGGAHVTITGSSPLSTQDDVAAALVEDGLTVFAKNNTDSDEFREHHIKALTVKPDLMIDDGGDCVALLHSERPDLAENLLGVCEETTTGVMRNRALEVSGALKFPVIAVNDAYCKYLFDNRYGTGQSVWDGIIRTTNLIVAGKNVVVIGYGWCRRGVAMRAQGLGAKVIVTETDNIKALEAHMDGFQVMPLNEAVHYGDYFVTVTGNRGVIVKEHMSEMKNGVILANGGHFDTEISKLDLKSLATSHREVREGIEEYVLKDGRRLYLLADGQLVNLSSADGNPAEIMDMTFALQALSLNEVLKNHSQIGLNVAAVTRDLDEVVAQIKLETLGIGTDNLTEQQKECLQNWDI